MVSDLQNSTEVSTFVYRFPNRWLGDNNQKQKVMEQKALNSLVRMELLSFVIFLLFLAGAYWSIEWLQWTAAVLFVVPVSGILRYRGQCKASGEKFDKARFAWAVITIFLYLGLGWLLLSVLG